MSDLTQLAPLVSDIRMRLHLERLKPGQARTRSLMISDRSDLGALFSAYRQAGKRVETRLENPFSRPMTVSSVAAQLDAFPPANRKAFLAYVDQLTESAATPQWRLPVYDLGNGNLLLMDGNHRAVATYIADKPFELELLVLHAPVDRRILAPLKYWDGGLARFIRRLRSNVRG